MPRFCLFGDTVNTASRMETTGAYGRIHASHVTQSLLQDLQWECTGGVQVKGKGTMSTYFFECQDENETDPMKMGTSIDYRECEQEQAHHVATRLLNQDKENIYDMVNKEN
eukprot:TRINITY_DN45450_c0_g1_i1.p2 TRINITY_DN45450_c0_g1~~TRINITY_DN45450_c0_g1_i1.p2  ORF type:complete len:111 (-),score=18.28 TRINITY_DN45450_c0_g1_i1:424-756(-)